MFGVSSPVDKEPTNQTWEEYMKLGLGMDHTAPIDSSLCSLQESNMVYVISLSRYVEIPKLVKKLVYTGVMI